MHSPHEPRLARAAALIADPARSRMLAYLMAGHFASASELAEVASIGASTASGHLARLLDSGFLVCEQRGRHRYYRLADADVAHALEALALVAERDAHARQWEAPARRELRFARRCYGHLAGTLGVALLDSLLAQGRLRPVDHGYTLTDAGSRWLLDLGCPPVPASATRFAYPCLDWSERRDHLAGALATTLLTHFVEQRWLGEAERSSGVAPRNRALRLTPAGRQQLLTHLQAVELSALT